MKRAMMIHTTIVKVRRDWYESELFEEEKLANENGIFIDKSEEEKQLIW